MKNPDQKRDEKGRFLPIHGGYSKAQPPKVRKYISAVRKRLIEDLGGMDQISAAQLILVDGATNILGICRCIEENIKGKVMEGKDLVPALRRSYLSYRNSLRLHLLSLGLDIKDSQPFTADRIIQLIELEKAEKKKEGKK